MTARREAIPRRIIQTGRARDRLSDAERAAVESIRLLAPDFEYLFFDDAAIEAFVADQYPEHLALFRSFSGDIRRIDLFRYLAVHRLGGFYFDLDFHLEKPLDSLLHEPAVFPFEKLTIFPWLLAIGMRWQLGNYAFGAVAGHPFLGALIEDLAATSSIQKPIVSWWTPPSVRRAFQVYHATGPGLVSRVYANCPSRRRDLAVLLPERVTSWNRFGVYGQHECAGTWKRGASFVGRRWLVRRNSLAKHRCQELKPEDLVASQAGRALSYRVQSAWCLTT